MPVEKRDLKKELKQLYNPPSGEPVLVQIPPMNYLMIDGQGDPIAREAQEAIETVYPLAYGIKFAYKKASEVDYGVMPLEGLWWADDMAAFTDSNRAAWKWTYMIMQPEFITGELFTMVLAEVKKKKALPAISKIRFEKLDEGLAAQVMHIGPFSAEGPTVEKLHSFIKDKGYKFDGLEKKHHEIYLSDIRKIDPVKMKTVIRQPVG
jgi:hypothetical protein